jgi:uncharacterized protein YndB with AHSA1/START domain
MPARPERVWAALTEGSELSTWFGGRVAIEARPGGAMTITWPDGTERLATVEEATPPSRLAFRWAPFERTPGGEARPAPVSRVEIELRARDGGSILTVVEAPLGASRASALARARSR